MMTGAFELNANRIRLYHSEKDRDYPLTFHTHVELTYVHRGEMELEVDGHRTMLRAGDLALSFPHVPHRSWAYKAEVTVLHFDPAKCGGLMNTLSSCKPRDPILRKERVPDSVPCLLAAVERRIREHRGDDDVVTPAYLTALMGELVEHVDMEPLALQELSVTRQILTYCMQNRRQDLTLETVADALFVSKAQITRTFLGLGMNFRDYINQLRIADACWLLSQTAMPVADIMSESGFNNQGTFNRLFLKSCGVTPSEYRALHNPEGKTE